MDEVNIKKIHKHWILLSEDKIPRVDRKINHGGFKGRRGAKIEVQDRRQVDLRVECKNSRGGSSPHLVLACLLASCRDALGLLLLLLFERGGNRFAREPKICRSPGRRGRGGNGTTKSAVWSWSGSIERFGSVWRRCLNVACCWFSPRRYKHSPCKLFPPLENWFAQHLTSLQYYPWNSGKKGALLDRDRFLGSGIFKMESVKRIFIQDI